MGQSVIKNPRKIWSQSGGDPSLVTRVETLENNENYYIYFAQINNTAGTITVPTGATIVLDQFQGGADAFCSTIVNGKQTLVFPVDSSGTPVDVATFDALGAYTLTGTPSAYPVALIYILKIKAKDQTNLVEANIVEEYPIDTKKVYVSLIHTVGFNSVNPADANYYYFGAIGMPASNTIGYTQTNLREYGCPATGVIKQAVISIRITNGGSVSTENSTLSIRNTTTNVLHTVTSTFNYNTGNNAIINKAVVVTGLNIAVTAGDQLMSVIGAPSWVTNPLGVYWTVQYLIELP